MMSGNLITPEQGLDLLDFPDLKSITSLNSAAIKNAEWVIGEILDNGKYHAPLPFMNLKLLLQMAQSAYLRGMSEEVPPARLAMLQELTKQIKDEIAKATPPAFPSPAPGGPPVTGTPTRAPPSNLLPMRSGAGAAPPQG
jgi:hypothetical protein